MELSHTDTLNNSASSSDFSKGSMVTVLDIELSLLNLLNYLILKVSGNTDFSCFSNYC
jgi:hypothetical protein